MNAMKSALLTVVSCACMPLVAARIDLRTDCASCSIETVGARVISFKGPDGAEALWNADPAQLTDPLWAHGGIPLCWPWYGRNGSADIHGTAWRRPFSVVSRDERRDRCELVLARDEGDIRLEYVLTLRDTLKMELKTTNRGSSCFYFSAAFHPYILLGERDKAEVAGLTPSLLPLTRAMDDAYPVQPGSCSVYRLHDHALDRTIFLFFENATEANIWNPGEEKDCPGMVPGDGWRRFVCIEPTLGEALRPVVLKAGESVSLMLGLDVRKGSKTSGYVGKDPRRPTAADEPTGRPFHVLYIGAHPDDFDYAIGAQAAKLVRAGAKVTAISVCNGCKGHVDMAPDALAARRCAEAQAAGRVYGCERYVVLDCPDCELEPTRTWRERLGRLVRDLAPDMIVTHRTVDYHADHRAVGQMVQDLAYFLGVPHWCPDTPVPTNLPFVMFGVDDFTSPRRVRPDLVMSAAGALDVGAHGLGSHVSQVFEWLPPELGDDPAKLDTPAVRAKYVEDLYLYYVRVHAKAYADVLEKAYGNREEPAAVAELSEYSRAPSAREIAILEAVPGFKWMGARTLDIRH